MFENYDDIMDIDEIAEALHIGRNSVYDLLRGEQIKSMKNGRNWIVPKFCVEEYVRRSCEKRAMGVSNKKWE